VGSRTGGESFTIEMAIPAELPRGANYCYHTAGAPEIAGLDLTEGRLLGLAVTMGKAGTGVTRTEFTGEWATLFEPYRLNDVTLVTGTPVLAAAGENLPGRLEFWPVVPNPAVGPTYLRFALPPSSEGGGEIAAELTLFDVQGRRVRTLVAGSLPPGVHELHWDGRDAEGRPAASGAYYARLAAGGEVITNKLIVLR
jgi:hypothetical protein